MLMAANLQKPASRQPKTPARRSAAERSEVRREAVRPQDRLSQSKKADGRPTISILKALLFSPIFHRFCLC